MKVWSELNRARTSLLSAAYLGQLTYLTEDILVKLASNHLSSSACCCSFDIRDAPSSVYHVVTAGIQSQLISDPTFRRFSDSYKLRK